MPMMTKKLFKHGGSYAVDLPVGFVKNMQNHEVVLEMTGKRINIRPKSEMDTIESEPLFETFIRALAINSMSQPKKLHKEIWDAEWESLLKGVTAGDE